MEPTENPVAPPPPAPSGWSPTERALLLSLALCAAVALSQLASMLRRV